LTPSIAIDETARPRLEEDLGGRLLRIAFTTGCGGSGYRLASADAPLEGDLVIDLAGLRVALDDMAARNLEGATIVWDDAEGGYIVDHPTAASCVWCG